MIRDSFKTTKPVEVHIMNDHRSFNELYERYQSTPKSQVEDRKAIINELIREVAQHSIAEETLVYPALEKHNAHGKGTQTADHLRQEHMEVKNLLYQLDQMAMTDGNFEPLLKNVMQALNEHAKEEEEVELKELQRLVPEEERIKMSGAFLRRKATAPTRSHPSAPDKPAALELAAGIPVHAIDVIMDQTRNFAERRIEQ